jgi:hypothetical protein
VNFRYQYEEKTNELIRLTNCANGTMDQYSICPICYGNGKTVYLQVKGDILQCPNCNSAFPLDKVSPLIGYRETWRDNSNFLFAVLRPELPDHVILETGLKELFEDCYHTLLIGRYNASIVMMGVFLEALMKERIRLKTGKDFTGAYAKCIDRLMGIKRSRGRGIERIKQAGDGCNLISSEDIRILDKLRDLRNTYAHFDEKKVVNGLVGQVYEIPFREGTILVDLETAIKEVKSGQRTPMLIDVTHPALRSVFKMKADREKAIRLFNVVYDFTLGFALKYLRQKDYDECNGRFPNPFVDLTPKLMNKQPLSNDSTKSGHKSLKTQKNKV